MPDLYRAHYHVLDGDNVLRRRLAVGILHQRNLIRAEDGGTALHAKRVTWADAVDTFADAVAMANRMLLDALADPVLAVNPEQSADADPDGRIFFILNNTNAGSGPLGLLRVEANLDAYVA